MKTTWDGKAISPEPPYGASIVVYRYAGARCEFLILHRAWQGADREGDWAWTPPSGARQPGETIEQCARRELAEETGLVFPLQAAAEWHEPWPTFFAEMPPDVSVRLDKEHDRFEWAVLDEAVARCRPQQVGEALMRAVRHLGIASFDSAESE